MWFLAPSRIKKKCLEGRKPCRHSLYPMQHNNANVRYCGKRFSRPFLSLAPSSHKVHSFTRRVFRRWQVTDDRWANFVFTVPFWELNCRPILNTHKLTIGKPEQKHSRLKTKAVRGSVILEYIPGWSNHFLLIWTDHLENYVQHFFYCYVCICYNNFFTKKLPRNDGQINGVMEWIYKVCCWDGSGATIYTSSFLQTVRDSEVNNQWGTELGDLQSLLSLIQIRKAG